MKTTIAILSLILSMNTFAYSLGDSTVITGATPFLTSATTTGPLPEKQAEIILNDSQEYFQSEKLSSFLGQKIKDLKASDESLSDDDAIDLLVNEARQILKR